MPTSDGRHARSERTRQRVAEAMLDCLEDGALRPSAKQIAERAGVSTRAVFRHFDNLEALLEEVSEIQLERVFSQLPPIESEGTLEQRVDALLEHFSRGNELVAPVRRAAILHEPHSAVIRARQRWLRSTVRRQVRRVFEPELSGRPEAQRREKVASICATLSFGHWDELRRYEKLSVSAARRALRSSLMNHLQGAS